MKKSLSGVIDRFEGNYAVLLLGPEQEEQMDVPRKLLPEDAGEGDLITVSFKISKNKTKEAKDKVKSLIEKLKRGE